MDGLMDPRHRGDPAGDGVSGGLGQGFLARLIQMLGEIWGSCSCVDTPGTDRASLTQGMGISVGGKPADQRIRPSHSKLGPRHRMGVPYGVVDGANPMGAGSILPDL